MLFNGSGFLLHEPPELLLSFAAGSGQWVLAHVPPDLLQRLRDHFTNQSNTMFHLEPNSMNYLRHLTQTYLSDPRIQGILQEIKSSSNAFYQQLKQEELLMAAIGAMVRTEPALAHTQGVEAKAIHAAAILQKRIDQPPTLDELVRAVMSNRRSLQVAFKKVFHVTIQRYSQVIRLERAKHLMLDPTLSLNDIAEQTGYEFGTNLSKEFKKYFGYGPREWRQGMRVGE